LGSIFILCRSYILILLWNFPIFLSLASLTAIQLRWVLLEGTHQQHMMARITLQNQTLQPIRNYFT